MTALALLPETRIDDLPLGSVLEGFARLHQLVVVIDARGRIAWMSKGLGAICGGSQSFIGQNFRDLLPPASEVSALAQELERGGTVVNERIALERGNGTRLTVDITAFWIDGPSPDKPLVVGIVRPADERERSARKLQHTVDFLAAVLDNAPDAVIAVDQDGFLTYANRAIEGVLGQPRRDVIDQPLAMLLKTRSGVSPIVEDLQHGTVTDHDLEITRPGGSAIWVSVSARPLRLKDGEVVGSVAFLRDVTERHQLAAELARKNEELESYVHTVSHDLRSPLVSVLGFTRLLRQEYEHSLDGTGLHFLDRIEQAGRTMETLIHDLLELSRIGNPNEKRSLVDPRAVLLQLQAELKPRIEKVGLSLSLPADPPMLRCDRTRLYQIFSNLLENALKHMGPQEQALIDVSIERERDHMHVVVSDNGNGIDPEHHERIFEVFQTQGPRPEGSRSSGIGLAIVKKIVETHDGKIWVDSSLGHGAAFHFTLPTE